MRILLIMAKHNFCVIILLLSLLLYAIINFYVFHTALRQQSSCTILPKIDSFKIYSSLFCQLQIFQSKSNSTKIVLLSFQKFLNVTNLLNLCFSDGQKPEFALVVPTKFNRKIIDLLSKDALSILITFLQKYEWLQVISGEALILNSNEKPFCSMTKNDWTLELNENYSIFDSFDQNRLNLIFLKSRTCLENNVQVDSNIYCYPCDLLPDVFLIKLSSISNGAINFTKLQPLQESARIPLFLELQNRSAYCPHIKIISDQNVKSLKLNLTCNNLRTIWDGNFILLPPLIGIYRLMFQQTIADQPKEYWLGCTWAQEAYEAKSIFHCSNWVRQLTFDVLDILENRLNIHYRLAYGSLLGAIRSGDVIPWSVDADIAIYVNWPHKFRRKVWIKVDELSQWRYSHLDRLGKENYPPNRAYPSCPISLPTFPFPQLPIDNSNRTDQISRLIQSSQKKDATFSYSFSHLNHDFFKTTGYVDLYFDAQKYAREPCKSKLWKQDTFEYIKMLDRRFKTFVNPIGLLECLYGKWNETPWWVKDGWDSFQ